MADVTYDRPVVANLWVHLADGTSFPATEADLEKFDLRPRAAGNAVFLKAVTDALGGEFEDGEALQLQPVIDLVSVAAYLPGSLSGGLGARERIVLIEMERLLREHSSTLAQRIADAHEAATNVP